MSSQERDSYLCCGYLEVIVVSLACLLLESLITRRCLQYNDAGVI